MSTIVERLAAFRVVPVVVVASAEEGEFVGEALADGGLPVAEVTFRTPAAADAIRAMSARGDVLVGAGTVTSTGQVDAAAAAGAQFLVSPGTSRAVVERAGEHGIPVVPGAVTATEIQAAIELGIETVKFFPAEASGGTAALTALTAPFGGIRFIPTGGIGPDGLADYLAIPQVVAVGGSWMLPATAVAARDAAAITRLTAQAVSLSAGVRPDRGPRGSGRMGR